ncbi:phenylalanine--tRNA ligase subunit beta, partial [Candidatus Wolfebacteria bacterium]
MLISYNWLQSYFEKTLPSPDRVGELFNKHSVELESIEKVGEDYVLDLGVLPDRAHYMLSHVGCARELSAIINEPLKDLGLVPIETGDTNDLSVKIENEDFCRRYIGRRVENITVGDSPDWTKNFLGAIGERSINSVVDATNLVMLDRGQPLHAFDADKIVGGIVVRAAKEGEIITLLDDVEITLSVDDSVISDDNGALAIAGVKGGKRAEVTRETKNIILESANFEPVAVRKTSRRLKLINNSSKRFENEITPDMAEVGMDWVSLLLREISTSKLVFGPLVNKSTQYR